MSLPITGDALTRGELKFAIVTSFNADTGREEGERHGDGSGDMTGTVRLEDGKVLLFRYVDGRFPIREDDIICWNEDGYSPANGSRGMSWPFEGNVLLVEVADDRVRRWTWPSNVISGSYGICDERYLVAPVVHGSAVHYRGLHYVVNIDGIDPDSAKDLVNRRNDDFPSHVVYAGHHADDFLNAAKAPYAYAVFAWEPHGWRCHLSGFAANVTRP